MDIVIVVPLIGLAAGFLWCWGYLAYVASQDYRAEVELSEAFGKRYQAEIQKIRLARLAKENEANLNESRSLADYYSAITEK